MNALARWTAMMPCSGNTMPGESTNSLGKSNRQARSKPRLYFLQVDVHEWNSVRLTSASRSRRKLLSKLGERGSGGGRNDGCILFSSIVFVQVYSSFSISSVKTSSGGRR